MKKSIIAFMAAIFLFFSLPMAYADYTSWEDSTYDFKSVKAVYIDAIDTSESGITSAARDMKLKEDFYRRVSKIKGPKVQAAQPEAETPGTLETEAVSTEVKDKAPSIVPKEAADGGADIYIYPKLTLWQVDSYLVPAHTEWRDVEVRDAWRDRDGHWHEFYRTETYPEYVPSYYVPCASVAVTFEWYDVKTGKLVATSEDSRVRGSESNPTALYDRIVDRFCKNAKKTLEK
ncbi:hypothetical protein [Dialister sp.]|uniref:hypothetical protein n=1 Tax=Dialister sp. TaxID=1955814 RepID=UPI0025EB5774|nr:hypothetical protein [Dialister sp.]